MALLNPHLDFRCSTPNQTFAADCANGERRDIAAVAMPFANDSFLALFGREIAYLSKE